MEKLASLRAALTAANPALAQGPDRLKIYVDKGRLVSRYKPSLAFEYRYTCQLVLEQYQGSPDLVMVPLLLWLRINQPGLLLDFAREDSAIQFAANILDDKSWDIVIQFELTEAVTLIARQDGSGWDVTHLPEPSPDDPLLDPSLADIPLAEIWLDGSRLQPPPGPA